MTREEAIENLKELLECSYVDSFEDAENEALTIAIKALEQQPNRCDSCVHSEEQDGSNCYECVKGMADNFETRSTDADCISRTEAIKALQKVPCSLAGVRIRFILSIKNLPSVTPSYNSIKSELEPSENYISKQDVDALVDELARAISDERCCISRGRSTATIMQDILDLPSVTSQPKIGKWIAQDIHNCHTDFKCSECGYIHSFTHLYGEPTADYTYCPNCGAKMEVEE